MNVFHSLRSDLLHPRLHLVHQKLILIINLPVELFGQQLGQVLHLLPSLLVLLVLRLVHLLLESIGKFSFDLDHFLIDDFLE